MEILPITSIKPKLATIVYSVKMYMKMTAEKRVRMVKSKPKALQHFKVDPILNIDEPFYKQAESKCPWKRKIPITLVFFSPFQCM